MTKCLQCIFIFIRYRVVQLHISSSACGSSIDWKVYQSATAITVAAPKVISVVGVRVPTAHASTGCPIVVSPCIGTENTRIASFVRKTRAIDFVLVGHLTISKFRILWPIILGVSSWDLTLISAIIFTWPNTSRRRRAKKAMKRLTLNESMLLVMLSMKSKAKLLQSIVSKLLLNIFHRKRIHYSTCVFWNFFINILGMYQIGYDSWEF